MKRYIFILLIFIPFYNFASFESDLYKTLSDFVKNPKIFFLDIETDTDNNLPFSSNRISTNLLLHVIGVANGSYNAKLKINDLNFNAGCGLWYFWGIKLIKYIDGLDKAKDINMFGASPFISISKDLDNVIFSFGSKISIGYVSFNFRDIIEEQVSDRTLKDMIKSASYIKEFYIDPAFFVSMLIEKEGSYKGIQIGYNIISARLFAKLVFGGETFSFFLGFYPDSPVIIHPGISVSF
ncbi:MAG TPA: hypothetical protein PKW55_05660 [Spirochaetota bacterium]|nr:hypothetical protein [Spirochaetota bacterium]